jgi:hypothetical protein
VSAEAELNNQHEFEFSQSPVDTDPAPTLQPTQLQFDSEEAQPERADNSEKKQEDVLSSAEIVGEAQEDLSREEKHAEPALPQAVETPVRQKRRRKPQPSPQTTPSPQPKRNDTKTPPSGNKPSPTTPKENELESTRMLKAFLKGEQQPSPPSSLSVEEAPPKGPSPERRPRRRSEMERWFAGTPLPPREWVIPNRTNAQ